MGAAAGVGELGVSAAGGGAVIAVLEVALAGVTALAVYAVRSGQAGGIGEDRPPRRSKRDSLRRRRRGWRGWRTRQQSLRQSLIYNVSTVAQEAELSCVDLAAADAGARARDRMLEVVKEECGRLKSDRVSASAMFGALAVHKAWEEYDESLGDGVERQLLIESGKSAPSASAPPPPSPFPPNRLIREGGTPPRTT